MYIPKYYLPIGFSQSFGIYKAKHKSNLLSKKLKISEFVLTLKKKRQRTFWFLDKAFKRWQTWLSGLSYFKCLHKKSHRIQDNIAGIRVSNKNIQAVYNSNWYIALTDIYSQGARKIVEIFFFNTASLSS